MNEVAREPHKPDPAGAKPSDESGKPCDPQAFALNMAKAMENGGKALAAYLQPQQAEPRHQPPGEMTELIKTLSTVANYWLSDEKRATDLQLKLGKAYLDLWGSAMRRMAGEAAADHAPPPRDKRFADPEWKSNQFFDFVMQAYLLTTQWAHDLVRDAEGLDAHTRKKAEFYVQQVTN